MQGCEQVSHILHILQSLPESQDLRCITRCLGPEIQALLPKAECVKVPYMRCIERCDGVSRAASVPVQSPTATAKQQLENARRELAAKGHKVVVRPASTCIAKGSLFMCSSMSAFLHK